MIDLPTPKIIIKTISMGEHSNPWGAQHKNKKYNSTTNSSTVVAKTNSNSMCSWWTLDPTLTPSVYVCVWVYVSLCVQLSLVSLCAFNSFHLPFSLSFSLFSLGSHSFCLSVCLTNLSPSQSNFQVPPSTYTQREREREEREKRRKRGKKKNKRNGDHVWS
jgi:hypothetical protein